MNGSSDKLFELGWVSVHIQNNSWFFKDQGKSSTLYQHEPKVIFKLCGKDS